MDIAIMIEGQNGLNWNNWKRLVRHVEDLGFNGLFRSDHFTNPAPPDKDSLDLWMSYCWLADHTSRLEFGPVVSPVSFRHPSHTVRTASAVDDLSGGRLVLGLGAGWNEREHLNYGFPLLDMASRFARFEEALEIITRLLRQDDPVTLDGTYYHLQDAVLLPRPARPGGPPILIGGNGRKRTLPLAARFADEWNAVYVPPRTFRELSQALDEILDQSGRPRTTVRRSLMHGIVFAADAAGLHAKLENRGESAEKLREQGMLVGTPDSIRPQMDEYAAAGVQRIMVQWMDLDDLSGLETLAGAVLGR